MGNKSVIWYILLLTNDSLNSKHLIVVFCVFGGCSCTCRLIIEYVPTKEEVSFSVSVHKKQKVPENATGALF